MSGFPQKPNITFGCPLALDDYHVSNLKRKKEKKDKPYFGLKLLVQTWGVISTLLTTQFPLLVDTASPQRNGTHFCLFDFIRHGEDKMIRTAVLLGVLLVLVVSQYGFETSQSPS